jgi:hypothetical protein
LNAEDPRHAGAGAMDAEETSSGLKPFSRRSTQMNAAGNTWIRFFCPLLDPAVRHRMRSLMAGHRVLSLG